MIDLRLKIKEQVNTNLSEVVSCRRWLHQHPELSFREYETAKFISQKLDEMGIDYSGGYAGTGIVAKLKGASDNGKVVALRADIDALPIEEENEFEYKSVNKGVMHACGHDAHTASLLGVAFVLNKLKDFWSGTVLFIFQPGEEVIPGGASQIISAGGLDNPKPDLIIGQHVLPEMESGHVGFKKGTIMASSDEIYITVNGKGGHAALPHLVNDSVLAASQIVVNLKQMVCETVPKIEPVILAFGKIEGKGAINVIPNKVEIEGTLRTLNEEWRSIIKEKIVSIATQIAESHGCTCYVNIKAGYPSLCNDEQITEKATLFAQEFLGENNVEELEIRMTAEDFSYYSQKFPSTFYRFGIKNKNEATNSLHTSRFNMNESSLETSVGVMSWLAVKFLNE